MVFHLQRRAPQECGVGLVIETINVVIFCWGKSVRKYFTLSDRDTKKPRLIPELWYQAEKNAIHYRKFVKHVIEVNSRFKDQPEHFSFQRILSHTLDDPKFISEIAADVLTTSVNFIFYNLFYNSKNIRKIYLILQNL